MKRPPLTHCQIPPSSRNPPSFVGVGTAGMWVPHGRLHCELSTNRGAPACYPLSASFESLHPLAENFTGVDALNG
jgi:hypothetical protein